MSEINKENLSPEVKAYITALEKEVQILNDKNQKQQLIIENLNEQLAKRNKLLFGKSSEKIECLDGSEQLSFFNEAELEYDKGVKEPTPETVEVKSYKRKPKRSKEEIQKNLRHKEILLPMSEEDLKCKECGSELVYIGKELVRHELHSVPSDMFIADIYIPKYKCVKCEKETEEAKIITVSPTPLPVKKSMAAPSTIAYIMVEKYQMGTPLYRLEKYWNSRGLDLNRNTFARWMILASLHFEPLIKSMNKTLMSLNIIHSDETSFNVLKRDGTVTNKLSSMWVIVSGKYEKYQIALYNYRRSKSQKDAEELLGDYTGIMTSDCYPVYGNLKKCAHSGCWAHCRRKFLDAVPSGKKEGKAYEAVQIIQEMFREDNKVLEKESTEEEILRNRQENVKPVLDSFWKHLENINPSPGSHLETAVNYAVNHKAELCLFADSGKLESTNNRAERAVKPFVMARKNFLFADTERGAEASARIFSMIETAKMNDLYVYGYLLYLLTELPKFNFKPSEEQIQKFLPWSDTLPDYCRNK